MKSVFLCFALVVSFVSVGQLTPYSEVDFWDESVNADFTEKLSNASDAEKQEWIFPVLRSEEVADEDAKKLVEFLLDQEIVGVDLRSKNEKSSMLDASIRTDKLQTALTIINRGYNVNVRCFKCDAETSIHILLRQMGANENNEKYVEVARAMIDKGADLDLRDMKGDTPFHIIIKSKNEPAFRLFLEEDVEFNYQSATLKGVGYLKFFDKKWGDDELRDLMMERSELKYPPTRKEIRLKQKENKKKGKTKSKKK